MKKLMALILAIVSTVGLVACGGGDETSGGDENILRVTVNGSDTELNLSAALNKRFKEKMAEQGKTVTIKQSTFAESTYAKDIDTLIATESVGDVIFTYDDKSGIQVKEGYFADLDQFIAKDATFDINKYDAEIIQSARSYKGKLAYMPRSFDQITMFINKDFFKNIGMEDKIPSTAIYGENWENWTWKALYDLCAEMRTAINNSEAYGSKKDYYCPLDANFLWNPVYDPILKAFGSYSVDVATLKSGFDSSNSDVYSKTLSALDFMKSFVTNEYAYAGWGSFSSGNQGMYLATRPAVTTCKASGIDVAFAPFPKFTSETTGTENPTTYVGYGSAGYAIFDGSKNKDLAWEYIKFVCGEEGQKIIGSNGSCVPVLKSELHAEGEWTKALPGVDQSAFIFNGYTRSLAPYARGLLVNTEFNFYKETQSILIDGLEKKSAADICTTIFNTVQHYITPETGA